MVGSGTDGKSFIEGFGVPQLNLGWRDMYLNKKRDFSGSVTFGPVIEQPVTIKTTVFLFLFWFLPIEKTTTTRIWRVCSRVWWRDPDTQGAFDGLTRYMIVSYSIISGQGQRRLFIRPYFFSIDLITGQPCETLDEKSLVQETWKGKVKRKYEVIPGLEVIVNLPLLFTVVLFL